MYVCVWEGGLGVDGGWLPLPTRPQLYCDLASLVSCGHATQRHCPSVRPSVCWSMVMELKSAKTHFDAAVLIIFVCVCWLGDGVDGG